MKQSLIPLVVALGFGAGGDAAAQDPPRQALREAQLDSIMRRVEVMVPKSGAPGTTVTLRSGGMPALTPLRIGVGAVRFGFEEVGQVLTDQKGEFSLAVAVPSWARRDLTHRFIVFDFYFVPIALSDVFYVTGPDGTLVRAGEVVTGGRCPVLRGEDGLLYALTGDLRGVETRKRLVVEGRLADGSACTQGIAIEVVRIAAPVR